MVDSITERSNSQQPVILANPVTAVGPMFLGNAFNWMLMGTLMVQVYVYWRNFPKDRLGIKILVYAVFVVDLIQTAFGTHEAWWSAIKHWGNPAALQGAPWTSVIAIPITCGLISAVVQIFYAMRIWILKTTVIPRLLAALIISIALTQSLAAIVGSSVLEANLTQANLIRLHPVFVLWLSGSFVADIIIAGSMIWILQTAKPRAWISPTESLLNRLIINSIQTGTVTVVCAGITLALFIHFTDKNYYYASAYILGKLYSNSFMATLNYRAPRTHSQSSDHSLGMRIQVSRDTERRGEDALGHWHTATDSGDDVAQKHA
ncbi:hypothetical protein C8J57DRAFT_1705172 [Mycena rebaudengoi]|nr:hypothetical protein C8J57DRAFT_1705172 [Mycena rebaudengoi]